MARLFLVAIFLLLIPNIASAQTQSDWYMAGANPERTSWVSEEVRGDLGVEWYRPIEPYIHYKFQPIAAFGKIYVSTARGLYAINANNGDVEWVYPTEMPLGQSPTVVEVNGTPTAYVPGYDRQIHALNANTGQPIPEYTPYIAEAGFETNPLIIGKTIYAGNRDGKMYALDAATGAKVWEYQTNGPILFSAAHKDGILYFASNDAHAYALNTGNGSLKWKSDKLPGSGFHSYWPVVYTNPSTNKSYVSFTGGENYLYSIRSLTNDDDETEYVGMPNSVPISTPRNNVPGDWATGTAVMDAGVLTEHFEKRPYQRFVFVLDANNGEEFTFDSDNDSKPEYAPFTWSGVTSSGTKYPAIINGNDNVYYQQTGYITPGWISRGGPVGWKFGTEYISRVVGKELAFASDEPTAYASGGNILYVSLCCDREAYAYDVSIPYGQQNRDFHYYGYNLASNSLAPGYQKMYDSGNSEDYNNINGWQLYSGKNKSKNGIYGKHANTQSPPIPYQNKVYMLKGNSLMAFSSNGNARSPLPLVETQVIQTNTSPITEQTMKQRLESEVQAVVNAGHMRPGYHDAGFLDLYGHGGYPWHNNSWEWETGFGEVFDYFSNPADTVYSLTMAYPHLSSGLQQQVKSYLQTHYGPGAEYDVTEIVFSGWGAGVQREAYETPPEASGYWGGDYVPPLNKLDRNVCDFCGYGRYAPFNFYATWKYADIVGNGDKAMAKSMFDGMKSRLESPLSNDKFVKRPFWLHQFIAGYRGYMELEKMAGYTTDISQSNKYSAYQNMLDLRVNEFDKDTPYVPIGDETVDNWQDSYHNSLAVSRNFMFLTPELAEYMKQNLIPQVQEAVSEYDYVGPYWFVSKFDASYGEGNFQPLYDPPAMLQAKAWILGETQQELSKYLDVPAFEKGDLFYIQNLVAVLEAPSDPSYTPPAGTPTVTTIPQQPGDTNDDGEVDILDYSVLITEFGSVGNDLRADFNEDEKVDILDYSVLVANFGA